MSRRDVPLTTPKAECRVDSLATAYERFEPLQPSRPQPTTPIEHPEPFQRIAQRNDLHVESGPVVEQRSPSRRDFRLPAIVDYRRRQERFPLFAQRVSQRTRMQAVFTRNRVPGSEPASLRIAVRRARLRW